MACYDSRDTDEKIKIFKVKDSDQEKEIERLKAEIAQLKSDALQKEVAVCAIMSTTIKFLDKFDLLSKYNAFEKIEKVKPSLVKYHSKHRAEDKDFYVKFLTKKINSEKNTKTKTKMEKELKKALKINPASIKALTDRSVYSSKFLKAAEPKKVKDL